MIKESLCTWRLQYTVRTQLMIWRWPSQNTVGMWTVPHWTRSSRTQFGLSINVWRPAGDTLNINCNFLHCNHQVHRDFLITLYVLKVDYFSLSFSSRTLELCFIKCFHHFFTFSLYVLSMLFKIIIIWFHGKEFLSRNCRSTSQAIFCFVCKVSLCRFHKVPLMDPKSEEYIQSEHQIMHIHKTFSH